MTTNLTLIASQQLFAVFFFDTLRSNLDETTEPTKVEKEIIDKLHKKIQQKNNKVKYGIFFRKAGG